MASVKPGQTKVRFSYSTDGGATWLPSGGGGDPYVDVWATVTATVANEQVLEQKFQEKQRIRRIFRGRIKVAMQLHPDQFGPNDSSDARLVWLQSWLRKPLLRIWTHDGAASPTGVNVDGQSYFASASNSNYVVPPADTEPDIQNDFQKSLDLNLEVAETVA